MKKNKICDLVRQNKMDFLALQEGNSGGILFIWRKSRSINLFSFQGEGYVGVCLEWGVEKTRCFVINVYSKSDLVSKRRLREYLFEERRSKGGGLVCC